METLIAIILAWFVLGFLVQLISFPRKDTRLSSRSPNRSQTEIGTRNENLGGFWVIWILLGVIGICIYLDRVGIIPLQ